MADLSYFGKNQSAPTDNFSEGVGSLREVLTENYPSSSSKLALARRAYNRRIQEQMGDLEFLKDLEDLSGIELSKGRGSVLASLGYYGSPDPRSDEGTASISHYSTPLPIVAPGEEVIEEPVELGVYIPKRFGFEKKPGEIFWSVPSPKEQKDQIAEMFKKSRVKFSGELPPVGGIALSDSDLYRRMYKRNKDWVEEIQKISPSFDTPQFFEATIGEQQGNTFRHEARHRGVDSDAFQELKASLRGAYPKSREFKLLNTMSRIMADIDYEHDIYELLRQLDQGQVTYEELSEKEQDRLDRFESMENALLDSFTERERLKLGLGFEEGGEVNSLAGVSAPYVYGIPESERGGSLVEFLSQFFPGRREVLKPSEVEWKDDPNIRYVPQTPFRQQEKDLGFNPKTGEVEYRGEYIPGEYGETEYALEYMPAVRALQNLQSAYIKHVLSPGQFERAVNIIKGAPSAIGNALIGQWAAIGTPPGTAALTPFTGETVYSASFLPPVGRATEVSKGASRALAPRTEMITPEGFSFPVPPPPPPTTMQMVNEGDKTPPLPSEELLATTPKKDPAGFFNKSQLVVQKAKLPQATGQQWQQLFQDKGINKAELEGLGLSTFLGLSGDKPITKEAVAKFIDQNRLEVGEDYRASVKSDTEERIDFISTEDPMFGELNLSWPEARREDSFSWPGSSDSTRPASLTTSWPEGTSVMDPSKVGYSVVIDTPGNRAGRPANWRLINEDPQKGEDSLSWSIADDDNRRIYSYAGVPMTLDEAKVRLISQLREKSDTFPGGPLTQTGGRPPRWEKVILRSPTVDRETKLRDSQAAAELLNYREIALTDLQTGGLHKNTRELINKLSEQAPMAAFKPLTEAQTQPGGIAAHNFPENTLVHLRVTDRPVEINGVDHENVLYAEEFQSDWAQGAIGRGILRPEDISRKAELLDKLSQIRVKYSTLPDFGLIGFGDTPEGQTLRKSIRRESTEIEDEIMALDQKQAYSPFLESGDKKGSVDQSPVLSLAISRLLREAVDNGQDYVVFSNYGDQVTRWGPDEKRKGRLEPLYQETVPNLAKKIVRDLGGYVKPKFKTKEKENKYYKQNPDKVGKEEDAFFGDTVIEPRDYESEQKSFKSLVLMNDLGRKTKFERPYSHLSANRFVVHITDEMRENIGEKGQPVLSRAAGGGINSLAEIARNMTRYANGGALIH